MDNYKFGGADLGILGGGGSILIGFLVLAMANACRSCDLLGSQHSFRKAVGEVVLAVYANAILYSVGGLWILFNADAPPQKGEVKFILFFTIGLTVWQLILLGMAVKNLFASFDRKR